MRMSDWSSDVCSSDLNSDQDQSRHRWSNSNHASHYAANERQHNRYANKAGHQQQRRSDQHGQAPKCKLDRLSDADTGTQSKRIKRERAQHRHQDRSEEHTSELQSLMRISYAVFCLKNKNKER